MEPAELFNFLRDREMWDRRRKGALYFYLVSGMLNLLTFGLIIYYGFLQSSWIVFTNLPFPIDHNPKVGSSIVMTIGQCNSSGSTGLYLVSRELVRLDQPQPDIELPAGPARVTPGCSTITSARSVVPEGTPPGRYELHGLHGAAGSWRTSYIEWKSQPFDVLPR